MASLNRPRLAIAVGLILPLVLPIGFFFTGREIWRIASSPSVSDDFWALYLQVLFAFRFFLYAFGFATIGRLLVAWGAIQSSRP